MTEAKKVEDPKPRKQVKLSMRQVEVLIVGIEQAIGSRSKDAHAQTQHMFWLGRVQRSVDFDAMLAWRKDLNTARRGQQALLADKAIPLDERLARLEKWEKETEAAENGKDEGQGGYVATYQMSEDEFLFCQRQFAKANAWADGVGADVLAVCEAFSITMEPPKED